MRRTLALLGLFAALLAPHLARADAPTPHAGTINAIVGDASFLEAHGRAPTAEDDELERIRTHLLWIEARLRETSTAHLGPELRARRARSLDVLHAYALAGEFPHHDAGAAAGRRPRFIDAHGRICAVGRLIEASAGRALAEDVSARHELDYLSAMGDHAELMAWAAQSGFTLEELASIQPTYEWREPRPEPPPVIQPPPPREEAPRVSRRDVMRALEAARVEAMQRCVMPSRRSATVHVTVIVATDGSIGVTARGVGALVDAECVASIVRGQAIEAGRLPPLRRLRVDATWSAVRRAERR